MQRTTFGNMHQNYQAGESLVTEPPRTNQVFAISIVFAIVFFTLTFIFRNYLENLQAPFIIAFLGISAFIFLSGRLETYILLLLIVNSTIFNLFEFPIIPIAIGDLYYSEALILTLLMARLLKRVTVKVTVIPKPMGYFVLAVIMVGVFSFIYAIIGFHVTTTRAGIELRTISYYSLFFLVIYYVRSHKQLKSLLLGMGVLTGIIAILLIVQTVLGYENEILGGRVEVLNTAGQKFEDMTRVLIPGSSLIILGLNCMVALYIMQKRAERGRSLLLPIIAVLVCGLIFTFTRSHWVTVMLSVATMLFVLRRRINMYPRLALIVACALIGGVILLQAKVLNPRILKEAVFERSISILDAHKNFRNDTLYMRYMESLMAWKKIKEHPLLGIGLGTVYRQNLFGNTSYERDVGGTMVHSGYLATQLKMGIPGTIVFLAMPLFFLFRSIPRWKRVKSSLYQAVLLGIIVFIMGLMFLNIGPSPFISISWVPVVAVSMGIAEK
ncbi:O-antigen ligase family protein, partial [bacterium]|nr:O-antigen ligase family protein [bacterium]